MPDLRETEEAERTSAIVDLGGARDRRWPLHSVYFLPRFLFFCLPFKYTLVFSLQLMYVQHAFFNFGFDKSFAPEFDCKLYA